MNWIDLAQDRDRCRAQIRVPYNERIFLTTSEPVRFTKRSLLHEVSKLIRKQVSMLFTLF